MKENLRHIRQTTLRIEVPPQPAVPPKPATSPRPTTPAWMDAWLGVQPTELFWSMPKGIMESATPCFMQSVGGGSGR
jgi:hypothetical protein